jgi:hypothetical protein
MNKFIVKLFIFILIWLFVSGFSGTMHELGHFSAASILGLQPHLSFQQGGRVFYSISEETIPKIYDIIVLLAGPLMTFILAICFSLLWFHFRKPFLLFYLAFWNSVFRYNVIIDGAGSDEWKLSQLLGLPGYIFPVLSIIFCTVLSILLIKRQNYFKKNLLAIPIGWILSGIGFRISFELLSMIFG